VRPTDSSADGAAETSVTSDSAAATDADSAAATDSHSAAATDADSGAATGTDSGAIPAAFASLCARSTCGCQTGSSPPRLVGSYSGQGTTKETSNSLWALNATADLVVHVVTQPGDGTVSGTAQVFASSGAGSSDAAAQSFSLPLTTASILGSGSDFTIYGTDLEDTGDGCRHGVQTILSGTVSAGSTITGCVTLVFTSEAEGGSCTDSEVASYPGTGATFQYTATLVDAQ
jgi:hypothetical protein